MTQRTTMYRPPTLPSIRLLFAALLAFGTAAAQQATAGNELTRPNVVYILADDLGYGDVSAYNPSGRIRTPNIDRLAAQGMRFTDAHAPSGVCTPTRYSLLTGRYPWRSRLPVGVLRGYSRPLIEADRPTVASLLQSKGYHTAVIGKWHLGLGWVPRPGYEGLLQQPGYGISEEMDPAHIDFSRPVTAGPNTLGFGESLVLPASLDMPPYVYLRDHAPASPLTARTPLHKPDTGYAGAFWREGLMAADFDFHDVLPAFTREACAFLIRQRSDRPFFLYLPLAAPHTPWMPTAPWKGNSAAGEYGDFVEQVDAAVGRIVQTLDSLGFGRNTIVVFTSDNGPYWRTDFVARYGHASAGPFRGMKGDAFEGGHRVPFIVRWPAVVRKRSVSDATTTLANLMATMAEITGDNDPRHVPEDSYSILPVLRRQAGRVPGQPAVVHSSSIGFFAIRMGDWKLIEGLGSGGFTVPKQLKPEPGRPAAQLYNLREDVGERDDRIEREPQKAAELRAMLDRIRSSGKRVTQLP